MEIKKRVRIGYWVPMNMINGWGNYHETLNYRITKLDTHDDKSENYNPTQIYTCLYVLLI